MEDILASIRRILNDDEPAPEAEHQPPAGAEPGSTHKPESAPDDVFVLDQSMLVEEPTPAKPPAAQPSMAAAGASPHSPSPQDPPTPSQQAPTQPMSPSSAPASLANTDPDDALMAPSAAAAASASMGALVRVVGQQQTAVYRGGPTLEDMVRDEIRPMVKSWLDEHLPPMVERMVRAEIARVTEGK